MDFALISVAPRFEGHVKISSHAHNTLNWSQQNLKKKSNWVALLARFPILHSPRLFVRH